MEYMQGLGIESRVFFPEEDRRLACRARDYCGIVLLGSNRSVNDPLPWIADEMRLVREAMDADVPVLGHCFGAQVMARSLGAPVCRNAWANIGWSKLQVTPAGRNILQARTVTAFNWHYETFAIPAGAQRLMASGHCMNKAFSIGKHLAFQCHFEVTEGIVRQWCDEAAGELQGASGPAAQTRASILADMPSRLPAVREVARRIYGRWAQGLILPCRGGQARRG